MKHEHILLGEIRINDENNIEYNIVEFQTAMLLDQIILTLYFK